MKKLLTLLVFAGALCAQFPKVLSTDRDLLKVQDRSRSRLSAEISAEATTVPVQAGHGTRFVPYEIISIEDEQIQICSVNGDSLGVCDGGRGFAGTTPAAHAAGALVEGRFTAAHHNFLVVAIKAIEAALGQNLGNVAPASHTHTQSQITDLDHQHPTATVATLPAANQNANKIVVVTDSTAKDKCDEGGGAVRVACVSDGKVWTPAAGDGGGGGGGAVWGAITGTLTDQTDLKNALDAKAAASHAHAGTDITSGTVPAARLGTETPDNTKFLRGDNTWQVPPSEEMPNYSQVFDTQTTVELTHELGTLNVIVACYDAGDQYIGWDALVIDSEDQATVTFAEPQTGRCVVNGTGGAGGGGGGGTPGGDPGQVQANNAGQFGGIPNSSVNFTSGATTLVLQDKGGAVHNVKAYGAKGDGATDDTVAIHAARDAIVAASAGGGGVLYFPPGKYCTTTGIVIGDGTATETTLGTASTYGHIRLVGAGAGDYGEATGYKYASEIRWCGAPGGTPVTIQGPIQGVGIENLRIAGALSATTLLKLLSAYSGTYRNLVLSMGGEDSDGLRLGVGSSQNVFDRLVVVQQAHGASGIILGRDADPAYFGISGNLFLHALVFWSGTKNTAYGWYFEGADNNQVIQGNTQSNLVPIATVENTTPIRINTSVPHGRDTGPTVRIVGTSIAAINNANYTITVIDSDTFSLDGTSAAGAGTGGEVWGGQSLYFKQMAPPHQSMPVENAFYNSAFMRGFITVSGTPGPNIFLPLNSGDGEYLPTSTSLVGLGHPEYYLKAADNDYMRFFGKWTFVRQDNKTAYVKFDPTTGRVVIGDTDGQVPYWDLRIHRTGANATFSVGTTTSGSPKIELAVDGQHGTEFVGDRDNYRTYWGRAGGDPFFVFYPATDSIELVPVAGDASVGSLKGAGNAYVCADANGKLYRSATPCVQ